MNEFDLIRRFFSRPAPESYLGVGDDCALVPVSPGYRLAVSTDLLIEGRHFFADVDPESLGHKALAVNLSDLAAMGARPLGCVLGMSLRQPVADWLEAFARGFFALADDSGCPLVGGDTTRSDGPMTFSVTVMGEVRPEEALRRGAAVPGDDIWVTGVLGAADVALRLLQGRLPADTALLAATRPVLERPLPPLAFGASLAGVAHAALDLSDGLVQDLGHILSASACGAELDYNALPVHPALGRLDDGLLREAVLGGGDVYELCFTASPSQAQRIRELAADAGIAVTHVGRITDQAGLRVRDAAGREVPVSFKGFDHFA